MISNCGTAVALSSGFYFVCELECISLIILFWHVELAKEILSPTGDATIMDRTAM